jgi:hypothetical protein
MDCPSFYIDELKDTFTFLTPLIIIISYMFTLLMNIGNICTEKQTKMKVCYQISLDFLVFT